VGFGVVVGVVTPSINFIWGWITMSFSAGMLMPLLLRWYWWRFNGYGYAIGTGVGILGAIIQKVIAPSLPEWIAFIVVGMAAVIGMLAGTVFFPPTEESVLKKFYTKTRPRGFWHAVSQKIDDRITQAVKRENRRDLLALCFAIPWQLTLFLVPVHIMIRDWSRVGVFLSVLVVSSLGLYFFWYRHLRSE
jgi:hypothetical protein